MSMYILFMHAQQQVAAVHTVVSRIRGLEQVHEAVIVGRTRGGTQVQADSRTRPIAGLSIHGQTDSGPVLVV
jgi:hypothetical protein